MRTRLVSDGLVAALALSALVLTLLAVLPQRLPRARSEYREIGNWKQLATAGRWIGPPNASVVLIEFADFQCVHCARLKPHLEEIRRRHPYRIALVYRHLPLEDIHPFARGAALASECAADQGRFLPYHDLLYDQQDSIGVKTYRQFAQDAGVADLDDFEACLREERFAPRLDEDIRAAYMNAIPGTPTLIVNGLVVPGVSGLAELEELVTRAEKRHL